MTGGTRRSARVSAWTAVFACNRKKRAQSDTLHRRCRAFIHHGHILTSAGLFATPPHPGGTIRMSPVGQSAAGGRSHRMTPRKHAPRRRREKPPSPPSGTPAGVDVFFAGGSGGSRSQRSLQHRLHSISPPGCVFSSKSPLDTSRPSHSFRAPFSRRCQIPAGRGLRKVPALGNKTKHGSSSGWWQPALIHPKPRVATTPQEKQTHHGRHQHHR